MPAATLPADQLAQLKQDLEAKQNDTSKLAKEIDHLKAQITDLGKTVGDIDQKASGYADTADDAAEQLQDLSAYIKTEKTMLKAALPPSAVTDVEGKKSAALQKLTDLKTKLADSTRKAADDDAAHRTAKDASAVAQAAYKAIAELPAANAEAFKDLTTLRAAADKQGAANSLGRQYFLVLVMDDRLGTIKALTPAEYKKQLNDAGTVLAQASETQATAKAALDAAVAAQQQARKDLDDARAKWRQETLDAIPATQAPPPAAPAPAGAGSGEKP